ncbi:MAG: M14 family zinc carboxypeptidase [Pseudomonadota bacterium]
MTARAWNPIALCLLGLFILSACATVSDRPRQNCSEGGLRLSTAFEGAPASTCQRLDRAYFALAIAPEASPINPSPWYAFALSAEVPQAVAVRLDYAEAGHRYHPWVRFEGSSWTRLDDDRVHLADDRMSAELQIALQAGRTEIAAQPLYLAPDYAALEARWPGDWRSFGTSVEGRPLRALVAPPLDEAAGWTLILGRQHPPEIPAAWSLEAFVDVLLAARASGEARGGLIVAPLLNPDGVRAGHWRLNANQVDLNRDWAARSQPEVRAVFDLLAGLGVEPSALNLVADFHSTIDDRLYLPQAEELSTSAEMRLQGWLDAMAQDGLLEVIDPRRTNPARRISAKSAFTDEGAALALTWETGDRTGPDEARDLARRAAEAWLSVSAQ